MKNLNRFVLSLFFWGALAYGATNAWADPELELVSDYRFSAEPVGTEKIAELDPEIRNPHRSRWVAQRKIQLRGLEAVRLPPSAGRKLYGVKAGTIESHVIGFKRGHGPWYRPMEEFTCTKESEGAGERFATAEGTSVALESAERAWKELLKKEKFSLSLVLSKVRAASPELALKRGLLEYENWLHFLEAEWHSKGYVYARTLEWKLYRDRAAESGLCGKKGSRPPVPEWSQMMEPVAEIPPAKPLARAPARRWNGLFSVRLNVEVGAERLNGQFLIDSSARASTISPDWLEGQGILKAWIEAPASRLEKFTWSGGEGLARRAMVDGVEMSGLKLDQRDFLLVGSDFYGPPVHLTSCCDGILGVDFLRNHVVEFHPGLPTEIIVWPKEGFRPPANFGSSTWFEVSLSRARELVSTCSLSADTDRTNRVQGAMWDTGSEAAAEVHVPWDSLVRKNVPNGWSLTCLGETVASGLSLDPPANPSQPGLKETYPAVNIGMPVLARGPFILDLPHGRIWFTQKSLAAKVRENRTGLELEYVSASGERVLKVVGFTRGSASEFLRKEGLRVGMPILRVNGKPAEEIDLWEVEQRLAGAYGERVSLEWEPRVLKEGVLPTVHAKNLKTTVIEVK